MRERLPDRGHAPLALVIRQTVEFEGWRATGVNVAHASLLGPLDRQRVKASDRSLFHRAEIPGPHPQRSKPYLVAVAENGLASDPLPLPDQEQQLAVLFQLPQQRRGRQPRLVLESSRGVRNQHLLSEFVPVELRVDRLAQRVSSVLHPPKIYAQTPAWSWRRHLRELAPPSHKLRADQPSRGPEPRRERWVELGGHERCIRRPGCVRVPER